MNIIDNGLLNNPNRFDIVPVIPQDTPQTDNGTDVGQNSSEEASNESTISNSIENSTPLISNTENKVEENTTPTFNASTRNSSGSAPGGFLSNNTNTLSDVNKIPGYSLI